MSRYKSGNPADSLPRRGVLRPLFRIPRREMKEIGYLLGVLQNVLHSKRSTRENGLPRCRHKSWRLAERLDLEEGVDPGRVEARDGHHTKRGHLCSRCRCPRVAGWGTRGWWYWPEGNEEGLVEAGHYGIGPCYWHSPYGTDYYRVMDMNEYSDMIRREMDAIRRADMADDMAGGRWLQVFSRKDEIQERLDTRAALGAVRRLAEKVLARLQVVEPGRDAVIENARRVAEAIGIGFDDLDEDVRSCVVRAIHERPMTEYVQGKLAPMSDKSAVELAARLIKQVGDQARDTFSVAQRDYIHIDEVELMLQRMVKEVERIYLPKGDRSDWARLLEAFRKSVLTGRENPSALLLGEPGDKP